MRTVFEINPNGKFSRVNKLSLRIKLSAAILPVLLIAACSDGGGTSGTGVNSGDANGSDLSITLPQATGTVVNRENIPIAGAVVTNEETGVEAITDSAGQFVLPIESVDFCASAAFGSEEEQACATTSENPELSPQITLAFVLDVPSEEIPVTPDTPLPPAPDPDAPARACGGLLGLQCAAGEYCDYPLEAICGAADATGTCKAVPEICTLIFAPVCGCDGVTYSSSCNAASAGISTAAEGECTSA